MNKNFGGGVSGYLDPTGRNWETAVFQVAKPLLDKELNLTQDVDEGAGQAALRRIMSSGWISNDFVESFQSAVIAAIHTGASLQADFPTTMAAQVNGWLLSVTNTGGTGENTLSLPPGPTGAGTARTDLVLLEVWRMLISAAPSTVGKTSTGKIWLNGNVKCDPMDLSSLNLVDDIQDANVAAETTKRVQIQYRLRVVSGVDVLAYPFGIDDPAVFANSVPASALSPDGSITAYNFANQSSNGDPGLWIAGDGSPTAQTALGTVDGYMYAIPLCGVFRRNTTAFDKNSNQNGGVPLSATTSDRPDGYFNDVFEPRDVVDLRCGVSPVGWNYSEVLQKNAQLLLDNSLQTEWTDTLNGGGNGMYGSTVFWCDQIGFFPGDGINTGVLPAGPLINQFDWVRRSFSDRATYEVATLAIAAPGGGWPNATISIDPSSGLAIYPYPSEPWLSYAPGNATFVDIQDAYFIGGASPKKNVKALAHIKSVTGLTQIPQGPLSLTFDALTGLGLTNETLYIDVLIGYPSGAGISKTPTADYGAASVVINNPLALPPTVPTSFSAISPPVGSPATYFDAPHREILLTYNTVSVTFSMAADTEASTTVLWIPDRAVTVTQILKNGTPVAGGSGAWVIGSDGRQITLTGDSTSPGDSLIVTYTAVRPFPGNQSQVSIYYEAAAPQTIRSALLPTNLPCVLRAVSPYLYVITSGPGSQDTGYPYPTAYVQTGGIYNTSVLAWPGEHAMWARAALNVSDFGASTGFLKLETYIPMVANPDQFLLQRPSTLDTDSEGRTFYKTVQTGFYIPNAYAKDLSDPKTHKVMLPVLVELTADTSFGRQGQLYMVTLTRWAPMDEKCSVWFNLDLTQNTTTGSVFHLKGNLLNRRA